MQTRVFHNHRFSFSAPGEFLVRLVSYSSYVLLVGIALLALFSGISRLQWFSLVLILFLLDRSFHIGQGEKTLDELTGDRVNVADAMTPKTLSVLGRAYRKARALRQNLYLVLMQDLVKLPDVREGLARLGIEHKQFLARIEERLGGGVAPEADTDVASPVVGLENVESLAVTAHGSALATGERFIEPRNLFVATALAPDPNIVKLLELFEVTPDDVQESVIFGKWRRSFGGFSRTPAVLGGFAHRPRLVRHRVMNRAWTARPTPTLDQFSTDLTDLAHHERAGFLIGHEREFETLLQVISRPGKPNALLVGEPGSGKSTIISHLAFRMVKDKVPPVLFDKRLVSLEIADLVANAQADVLSGRIQKVVEEIILAGNIVLFIPNIHDLFRTTQAKALNAIDLLLPIVKNAAIPTIGETYPREFKQFIEPRSDFLEQFETVPIEEISEAEAVRFLVYSSILLEREFQTTISFRAIRKAVSVAHRYFRSKPLPGSALDLMKQALAKAASEKRTILDENDVIAIAESQSKIPIQKASTVEAEKLLNLESIIHERLVDQEAAVSAVARALREYRSGLSRRGGPIATFLFVGPTGVGKTELAKILSTVQFGSKDFMHRFDMTEYQDKQSIFRFIGTPDGERTGTLTDAVLKTPYALVLLDEFEKAHPDILNLFLQVFDDGRLTDSLGRTVDFSNTIIIATSNAHSDFIKAEIERGRSSEEIAEDLKKKLTEYFRPELVNRFSDVIVFRSLQVEEIKIIAGFLVREVAETLKETHGIELQVDGSAIAKLAELGYSPVFGARPLRAAVSEKVRSVLAEKILRREVVRGNTVRLVCENGQFGFTIVS